MKSALMLTSLACLAWVMLAAEASKAVLRKVLL